MVTETVVDLANAALLCNTSALPHMLDGMAEPIVREEPPTLHLVLAGLTRDPYLREVNTNPTVYVEGSVDDLPGLF